MSLDFVDFEMTGVTPVLYHADDVMQADTLTAWRKNKDNKSLSVAGDDRSPAWTWMTYLYHDGDKLVMPQENIMAALRRAGQLIPHGRQSNLKALTQSGLCMTSDNCEFLNAGREVPMGRIMDLRDKPFAAHVAGVRPLGFELLVKRARVGTSKHVRVRAKFRRWSVRGTVAVNDPVFTLEKVQELFDVAGERAGVGDWRPSAKESPGPHGKFTTTLRVGGKTGGRG